jgi:hypothetical protein
MADPDDVPLRTIDDLKPDEVDIETIEAFHLGGTRYAASFELSDENSEFARSYLLDIEFGDALTFTVRKQIEDTILSHASLAPDRHIVLELGKLVHDLTPGGDTVTKLRDGMLRRLWHFDENRHYVIGDRGVAYIREAGVWERIETLGSAVLKGIHGPRPDAVHVCGHAGLIARLDGRTWIPLEIPVQRNFHAIEVSEDGAIHVGGADGAAYAIVADELIELESQPWDYYGVLSFKGRRYWTDANYGISVQEGNRIVPLREPGQGFYMHASPDKLVVSGWKEVFIFDGTEWSGFEFGYDGNIFLSRLDMTQYGG